MKFQTILGVLLIATYTNAQQVKVSWSEENKKEVEYGSLVKGPDNDMIKLCFENSGGLFTKKTVTPILTRYDNKLNEKTLKSFTVTEDNMMFDNLLSVKGNLFMFSNAYDRSQKATTFYSQKIDGKTLAPVGRPITLGVMSSIDRRRQSTADYELSKDSSKILFFGLTPYKKKETEKYYMAVYSSNMEKQWDKTVELPYLDKYIEIYDYIVTNNGSVGVVIKHYDKEIKKEKVREDGANVPAYKSKLLLYNKDAAKPVEYVLDLNGKFAHNLQVTSDKNSNLTMFGLYKNKYDGYINGYLITSINHETGKVELNKMEAFPDEMLALVKKDKQGSDREKDPGLSAYFSLVDVVERADGSIDYLLEYYKKVIVHVQNSRGGSYSYPVYYYGDVIDIHTRGNGKTDFVRLPKYQQTSNTALFSSFKAITANNKLFLFYNDDRDNLERDITKRPDDMLKFTKSILAMATIDAKGNLTRSMVYDHREMKLTTCVAVSQKIGTDRIGLYAQRMGGMLSAAKDMVGILELK